jgi:hypothetical protein
MIGRGLVLRRLVRRYAEDAKLFRAGVEGYLERPPGDTAKGDARWQGVPLRRA